VVKLEAGLERNTTALAISSGVPIRPVGFSASCEANRSGRSRSAVCQNPFAK
jgi:hypothetical protein